MVETSVVISWLCKISKSPGTKSKWCARLVRNRDFSVENRRCVRLNAALILLDKTAQSSDQRFHKMPVYGHIVLLKPASVIPPKTLQSTHTDFVPKNLEKLQGLSSSKTKRSSNPLMTGMASKFEECPYSSYLECLGIPSTILTEESAQ